MALEPGASFVSVLGFTGRVGLPLLPCTWPTLCVCRKPHIPSALSAWPPPGLPGAGYPSPSKQLEMAFASASLLCLHARLKPRLCSFPRPSPFPCPSAFSSQLMPPALLEHSSMGKPLCKRAVGWGSGFSSLPPAGLCCH